MSGLIVGIARDVSVVYGKLTDPKLPSFCGTRYFGTRSLDTLRTVCILASSLPILVLFLERPHDLILSLYVFSLQRY